MNKAPKLLREGYLGAELSGRRESKYKGPEAGPCLIFSRNSRETDVPRVRGLKESGAGRSLRRNRD